jgi:hypothetical protein
MEEVAEYIGERQEKELPTIRELARRFGETQAFILQLINDHAGLKLGNISGRPGNYTV